MVSRKFILIAEDDANDAELIRRAFETAKTPNPLRFVRDGAEVIDYLSGEGAFKDRNKNPLPALLLLDVWMPLKNGFEVLKWLRSQAGFSSLPVILLTGSQDMRDVNRAYQLGANSFLLKPAGFHQLVEMSQNFLQYWLQNSVVPETFRPPPASPLLGRVTV